MTPFRKAAYRQLAGLTRVATSAHLLAAALGVSLLISVAGPQAAGATVAGPNPETLRDDSFGPFQTTENPQACVAQVFPTAAALSDWLKDHQNPTKQAEALGAMAKLETACNAATDSEECVASVAFLSGSTAAVANDPSETNKLAMLSAIGNVTFDCHRAGLKIKPKLRIERSGGDCFHQIEIFVWKNPLGPTTLRLSWGDGIAVTIDIPQGIGKHVIWRSHQYAHPASIPPLPPWARAPKIEVITATVLETDESDIAFFVHGQPYVDTGSGEDPGGLPSIGNCGGE